MPTKEPPGTSISGDKPLADRAEGPRQSFWQRYQTIANAQGAMIAAAFSSLKTPRGLREGLEGGAFAILSLVVVHGAHALWGMLEPNLARLVIHGMLTLTAIVAYYAVLHGRSMWPSLFVLGWYLIELFLSRQLLGYRWGATTLNVMMLPLAILAVRASWRRRRLLKARPLDPNSVE